MQAQVDWGIIGIRRIYVLSYVHTSFCSALKTILMSEQRPYAVRWFRRDFCYEARLLRASLKSEVTLHIR